MAARALQILEKAIALGKEKHVRQGVQAFKPKTLTEERYVKLTKRLLETATKNSASSEVFQALYEELLEGESSDRKLLMLLLMDKYQVSNEVLTALKFNLSLTFQSYIEAIAPVMDTSYISTILERLYLLYPETTSDIETIRTAVRFVEPSKNTLIIPNKHKTEIVTSTYTNAELHRLLVDRLESLYPYADIPEWVMVGNYYEGTLPFYPDQDDDAKDLFNLTIELPSAEKAADLLLMDMQKYATKEQVWNENTVKNARETIVKVYSESTNDKHKFRLLQPVYIDTFIEGRDGNMETEHFYGPSNPYIVRGEPGYYRNSHMLTSGDSISFDIVERSLRSEDEASFPTDWFTGKCDHCGDQIEHFWHAVRIPMLGGGWLGCYCKWEHAILNIKKSDFELETHFSEGPGEVRLIKYFAARILSYPIYDRIEEDHVDLEDNFVKLQQEYKEKLEANPHVFNEELAAKFLAMGF